MQNLQSLTLNNQQPQPALDSDVTEDEISRYSKKWKYYKKQTKDLYTNLENDFRILDQIKAIKSSYESSIINLYHPWNIKDYGKYDFYRMDRILEYVQKTEEKLIKLAKYRLSYYTQEINKSNDYYATSEDSYEIEYAINIFERRKQKFLEDAYYSQAIRHVYYEQTGTTPEELGGHLNNTQEVVYYLEAKKNFLDLKGRKKFDNELLKEFEDKFVENDEN